MRTLGEPCGQATPDPLRLDLTEQRSIEGRQPKGLYSERLSTPVRKYGFSGLEFQTPNEKSGLLDFDFAPEGAHANGILGFMREVDDRPVKLLSQFAIQDWLTLVAPATVVVKNETKGLEAGRPDRRPSRTRAEDLLFQGRPLFAHRSHSALSMLARARVGPISESV
jgi:hypothetical protein